MKLNTMLVAKDLEVTKKFYKDVFGARVIIDFGTHITLTGGLSFQTLESWAVIIHKPIEDITFGSSDKELYYECEDLDSFIQKVDQLAIPYVHKLQTHDWGQRGIRLYDPDQHIIEIAETLSIMVKRLHQDDGLVLEEIALKTGLTMKAAQRLLQK